MLSLSAKISSYKPSVKIPVTQVEFTIPRGVCLGLGVWRRVETVAAPSAGPVHCTDEQAYRDVQDCPVGSVGPLPSTTVHWWCVLASGGGAFSAPALAHAAPGRHPAIGVRASATLQCSICRPRSKAEATAAPQCAGRHVSSPWPRPGMRA